MLMRRMIYGENGKLLPGIYLHGNLEMNPDADALIVNRNKTLLFPGQGLDVDELLAEYGRRLLTKAELQALMESGEINSSIFSPDGPYVGKYHYTNKQVLPATGVSNIGGSYNNPSVWNPLGSKSTQGMATVVSDTIGYSGYMFYDIVVIRQADVAGNNNILYRSGSEWTHIYTGMLFIVE